MESDDRALWDFLVALRERWITPNQFMEIIHGIDALCSFFALMPFPDTAEVGEVGIYGVATPAPVAQKVSDASIVHNHGDGCGVEARATRAILSSVIAAAEQAQKADQHGDCLCCCRKHGGRGFTQGCVKCEQERADAQAQESTTWTDEQVRAVHEEADRFLGEFKQKPQAQEVYREG